MAYQTNLLIMSAGSYRIPDFVRVGVPPVALMLVTLMWALSTLYL